MAEAAGFAAIEIEDQILPKRAHHHIGIEHIIPQELMAAKIAEAVRARREPNFVIIGRTNAARTHGLDEALRRAEAYHKAGADMLFVLARNPEEARILGERLPPPLMYMVLGGMGSMEFTMDELAALGYRLVVDPVTPLLAMHRVLRQSYAALARGEADPLLGADAKAEQNALHEIIGLDRMLEIERRTVER
jgi:methylisocitrate lyase